MNNLAPMKNRPGVQGNLNWMPGNTTFDIIIKIYCLYLYRHTGIQSLTYEIYIYTDTSKGRFKMLSNNIRENLSFVKE